SKKDKKRTRTASLNSGHNDLARGGYLLLHLYSWTVHTQADTPPTHTNIFTQFTKRRKQYTKIKKKKTINNTQNYHGQHRGGHGQGQRDGQRDGGQQRDGQGQQQQEKPKKENILDLTKYMDKEVNVKFNGGREVTGVLKGYDQLMNLVLDDVKETMRGKTVHLDFKEVDGLNMFADWLGVDDNDNVTTRSLGLIVARGTLLVLLSPADGSEEIANPFVQQEDE
ncbi:U6 snRNP-associated protein Lsm7, partial [Trichophyton benhamiae CBS 112371]